MPRTPSRCPVQQPSASSCLWRNVHLSSSFQRKNNISAEQMEQLLPSRTENQWFGMCGQWCIESLVCFLLIISVFICLAKKKRNPYSLDTVGSALMHWQAHYHWSLAAGCSAKVGNYHYEGKRCYLIGWTPADAWSCDPPELIGPSFTLVILVGEKDWKGRHILLAKSNLQ